MGFLDEIRAALGYGALSQLPREQQGVGSDLGLTGARIDRWRSPYEPTLGPGETRTKEDLRSMLGDVILAAGSAAIPGVGPKGVQLPERQSQALPTRYFHTTRQSNFSVDPEKSIHLTKGRYTPNLEGTAHSFTIPQEMRFPLVSDQGTVWGGGRRALLTAGILTKQEYQSEKPTKELLAEKGYGPGMEYPNVYEGTHNLEKVFGRATRMAGKRLGIPASEVDANHEVLPQEWIRAGAKRRALMVLDPTILRHEKERARRIRVLNDLLVQKSGSNPTSLSSEEQSILQQVPSTDFKLF